VHWGYRSHARFPFTTNVRLAHIQGHVAHGHGPVPFLEMSLTILPPGVFGLHQKHDEAQRSPFKGALWGHVALLTFLYIVFWGFSNLRIDRMQENRTVSLKSLIGGKRA